jgi:hypothetical protein
VIISDFLTRLEGLETQLALFRAMGHEIVLAQVLDPAEVDFPFEKPGAFQDLESGRRLVIDPRRARESYLGKFGKHLDALRTLCAKQNITHRLVRTDQPLETFLFEFLSARSRFVGHRGARRRSSSSVAA